MAIYLGEDKIDMQLKANLGDAVEWTDVINKPSTYPPSLHTHDQYQLTSEISAVVFSGTYEDGTSFSFNVVVNK